MGACVLMVGEGVLADFVYEKLSVQYQVVRQIDFEKGVPEETGLALVLHDAWHPSAHHKAEEVLRPLGIPWLRGFVSFGEGVIGPLVRPNTPGCSQCADMRRLIAGYDRKEMWELQQMMAVQGGIQRDAWASRAGLLQMAYLIAAETKRVLEGSRAYLEEKVFLINLKTLKNSCHFFLPDPLCTVCGQLPDDSPTAAQLSLQPSPKISADSYRCRPIEELKEVLVKDYLDYRTGLLNGKMHHFVLPFADVVVNMPMFIGDEGVAGRTHSYEISGLTAILEGLERYCGIESRGKRTVVYDSYRNLADQALNPLKVGVHAEEQYARPDFPFKPFHPDRPMNWVWGYSFLQERPILVPELLAYYSLGGGDGFVYETSNGCALGGSLEEAIFHAILEVVERDSFLMTWYAQLPLPRLDLRSANDKELQLMVDRVRAVAGYDLYFFNSTMEHGIPSVWAVAKNRKQKGLNLICAAGAHPDPLRAVKSAIHELAGMMLVLDEKFEANRKKYEKMLHDPLLVQQMEDHGMLYGLPEAEERLQFLLDDNRPLRTFEEEFKQQTKSADLTDELWDILQKFRRLNLEVIVVDQTTPVIKRNGLYCVKVLIPGMLPMTFGHHLTRVTGLERVLRVPMELGYTKQPLTLEQLNPHPHPFP
ncbi:TOMM precursor leader peptide-binding protein [Parageobacillus thermoglucosidasius]|uniref:TOMM precursor leader peptide-binding protein n=1 Tax=Parageobacillus thermoglucosidasius TaxID=1426 RepID=UPI000E1407F7|nr:TOMM precursor leader peptide-binding protein [Parageobacillus thermoglucosidasius]MED4906240.1 TOMM precursor leader peptide-binding protein [Parageobacillus thermoglucosidasius]MED4915479.1 TOMM precursor leader peptide-binding protein [Parageobacillus thermoglucosidasius]MED4945845.1 TOMM precursor leader peptide-binding protein [Parageobacillus thermoglucosidasius]MED4984324.1 TOMM precursor leader peptide-binding protein [Parageobacillus thermoglucosidasius]RDE28637.1 bacteriocin biosy